MFPDVTNEQDSAATVRVEGNIPIPGAELYPPPTNTRQPKRALNVAHYLTFLLQSGLPTRSDRVSGYIPTKNP